MEITETSADGLKHEYRVVVPATDIDERIQNRLTELSKTVNMNGFRPGKVPVSVVKKRFGPSVMGEILEQAIAETSAKALEDEGVRPALQPQFEVKQFSEGVDLEYTMSVEALPTVEPPDLSQLKLTKYKADVADETVEEALKRIAAEQKSFTELSEPRPAEAGDVVVIDFAGTIDGEPFEGGTGEDSRIEIGSGMFLKDFEDGLVGKSAGEETTVNLTFPDDYPSDEVKGKEAAFAITVKQVLAPEPIEVSDELATRLGLADLDALRTAAKGQIERDYTAAARNRLKRDILDTFAESHQFEVPEGMVDREFHSIWHQIEDDMKRANLTWEEAEQNEDDARAEYRSIAQRRVRLGLLLAELGQANNITVPQDELNRAVMDQARRYPGQEQKIFDYFRNSPEAMNELRAPLFEDKVIDFIVEMADVSEETVPPEDLLRDPDEPAEPEADAETDTAEKTE